MGAAVLVLVLVVVVVVVVMMMLMMVMVMAMAMAMVMAEARGGCTRARSKSCRLQSRGQRRQRQMYRRTNPVLRSAAPAHTRPRKSAVVGVRPSLASYRWRRRRGRLTLQRATKASARSTSTRVQSSSIAQMAKAQ